MKRQKAKWMAAALAFALAACTGTALATGFEIQALQGEDPEAWPSVYVPPNVDIRRMRLPLVSPKEWAVLYVAPEEEANMATIQPGEYIMRYIGTEGGYYKALNFDGKVMYIKASDAQRSSQTVDYAKYPAGRYVVGRTIVLEESKVMEDPVTGIMETVSEGEYETRPWSESVLEGRHYYAVADAGKEMQVTVSRDEEGKDVVQKLTTNAGGILHLEDGQYATVKNGSLYSYFLAPSAILDGDMAANAEHYNPGEGNPYDPNEEYAWTDEMALVAFK